MSEHSRGALACQFETIRRSFAQAEGLPFAELLSDEQLAHVGGIETWDAADEPVYSPWVTLEMFLSQTLDRDHSCRQAVARLAAHLAARNEPECGVGTGGYCKARRRLSTVIDEILDPVADCLTPDVAKRLTELRLNPTTQARIDELAGQANEGLLTSDERAEYADIVEGLDFLGILKASPPSTPPAVRTMPSKTQASCLTAGGSDRLILVQSHRVIVGETGHVANDRSAGTTGRSTGEESSVATNHGGIIGRDHSGCGD